MADEIKTVTRQNTYTSTPEGSLGFLRLNPIGNLCVSDQFMQWVWDGRVFNASNVTEETPDDISSNGRGTANINPALLLDVPEGKTAVPLEVMLDISTDGTDEDVQITINTDDAVRYSSSGAKITPINMRKDDIRTSGCPFYCGTTQIVASTNTDDDTLYATWVLLEALPRSTITGLPTFFWSARQFIPPVLVGPASLTIFIDQTAADKTYYWSVKWAEFDTGDVIRG